MGETQFSRLLNLLNRLHQARIPFQLRHSREDALMVVAFAPGQYWEIDFLEDGGVDIERFHSKGKIEDEGILEELFALWTEDKPSTDSPEDHNATHVG